MTVPNERTRAVQYAHEFLKDLLYRDITPRVPKAIRERARMVLRHFPSSCDLKVASEKAPDTFGEPYEEEDYYEKKMRELDDSKTHKA